MWEAEIKKAAGDLGLLPFSDEEAAQIEKKILDKARHEVPTTKAADLKVLTRATWRVAVGEAARALKLYRRDTRSW